MFMHSNKINEIENQSIILSHMNKIKNKSLNLSHTFHTRSKFLW